MKSIVAHCRKKGIRLVMYLDDILLLNQDKSRASEDFEFLSSLLMKCDFLINWEKSVKIPSQVIHYLGLILDSRSITLALKPNKVNSLRDRCKGLLEKRSATLREIASVLGHFAWAINAIPFAQCHYRNLQRFFIDKATDKASLKEIYLLKFLSLKSLLRIWSGGLLIFL